MLTYFYQLLHQVLYSSSKSLPLLNQSDLINRYEDSTARLLLFDWDGTLTPIVRDPAAAVPTPAVIEVLQHISSSPKNEFWIISGRNPDFLEKCFSTVPSIGLSAEHGAFLRSPGNTDWEIASGHGDKTWQHDIMKIFEDFTSQTPGSVIERKNVSITWHYRNAIPEEGTLNAKKCRRRLDEKIVHLEPDLEVMEGKMCLEVRPRDVNKGFIAQRILAEYRNHHGQPMTPDFVLCVGDDVTDEG